MKISSKYLKKSTKILITVSNDSSIYERPKPYTTTYGEALAGNELNSHSGISVHTDIHPDNCAEFAGFEPTVYRRANGQRAHLKRAEYPVSTSVYNSSGGVTFYNINGAAE